MSGILIELAAFFVTGALLSTAALVLRDSLAERQRDREAREWRRQWYEDYRKQQERRP